MKEIDMQQELIEMLDKMVKYFDELPSDSYYAGETCSILTEAEKLVEKAKNNAPAQGEPFGYFRAEPFGWTDCAKDDEGAVALYDRPQESELRKELDSANDFIKSLADLIQKYEKMLGYRTTNAPEGAYALAEAKGESSLNTELDLACADFTCQHDFALDPKSSIRICLKCGTPERLAKKTAAPAQEVGLTDAAGLSMLIAGALFDFGGYLTTHPDVIDVGSTALAGPVADRIKVFAAMRGLSLDDAAVMSWSEAVAALRAKENKL